MKRIIICCDGTWNNPEREPVSNVVKVTRALAVGAGGIPQVVFYDWGVGSEGGFEKLSGGIMGFGIDKNIQDAYRFLVHNYETGDEIALFGFSRGAYTARSLVGMLRNVGLLQKRHADLIVKAYGIYRQKAGPDAKKARIFRGEFSREIKIYFLGVWDTVGALGIPVRVLRDVLTPGKYEFHDTRLSKIVNQAAQALALDEQRVDFKPAMWRRCPPETRLEQAWFAGVHADVGGGYKEAGLADIALMWMVGQAEAAGLRFDRDYLEVLARPDVLGKQHRSYRGFYWIKGRYLRPVGELGALEEIHSSVRERMLKMDYRPVNL